MKKQLYILCLNLLLLFTCQKEADPFLITKHSIGPLTDSTKLKDISSIFANDSVVNISGGNQFTGRNVDIEVYDRSGKLMLILSPKQAMDSMATISTVKVMDPRFKTALGLNMDSTFGDLESNYDISSIQNTIRNVVVFVNNINGFFTIDKMELPPELRFDMEKQIEAIHIPDNAKIKYFMIGW